MSDDAERWHREELAAFDAELGLPPEAFLTRREWLVLQRSAPMIHGAGYVGGGRYQYVSNTTGEPARFFDDRVQSAGS